MAPFKLKFRMGSSRSTSQEHDPDPQVNEALLNHHSTAIGASNSTIDSADCNSLASLGTNERKSLLPSSNNKSNNLRLGYLNHNITHQQHATESTTAGIAATTEQQTLVPTTPPPSYEHVLEENTRLANNYDLTQQPQQQQQQQRQQQSARDGFSQNSRSSSSINNLAQRQNSNSIPQLSSLEHLSLNNSQCNDPDCQENYTISISNEQQHLQRQQEQQHQQQQEIGRDEHNNEQHNSIGANESNDGDDDDNDNDDVDENDDSDIDNRKESIDSTELLITTTRMASPSSQQQENNYIHNCTGDCQQYDEQYDDDDGGACGGNCSNGNVNNDFFDPLMNHGGYCNNESHYNSDGYHQHSQNQVQSEYMERSSCGGVGSGGGGECDSDDGCWGSSQMSNSRSNSQQQHYQQQQQQQQQQQYHSTQQQCSQTPEITSNKSSKEIYKDLAKQWGITCKMSDGCRCMECQSHYFDCEFDDNEHQKSDGGLGAGTPMFISEVMHGTACNIL